MAVLAGGALAGVLLPAAAPPPTTAAPVAAVQAAPAAAPGGVLSVRRTTTEFFENPLGIDAARPRLGWVMGAGVRGAVQSAYRVQVASKRERLEAGTADVWDSGQVRSSASTQVAYDGPPLAGATRYHWRVQVWDAQGGASAWSTPAWWETGLLTDDEWQARWISPAGQQAGGSYLRGSLEVPGPVASARLYVSGRGNYERGTDGQGICCEQGFGLARGIYEPFVNGTRVSATEVESTSVDTRVRALYRTYDVTDEVRAGSNALGLMIGEDSDVLAQLVVRTVGGDEVVLATDAGWSSAPGPVTRAHRFHGERYDAARELDGWAEDAPEGDWDPVRVAPGAAGRMDAAAFEPMEIVADHRAVEVTEPAPGVYVLDFGQNRSGWTRLQADLPAGAVVSLKHGERLTNGRVDNNVIGAQQTSTYTADGAGPVDWEPSFVYGGFRWVEVTGLPEAPGADTVVAREVHNAVARTGSFSSSDPLLDRLHRANVQTQVNGLHQVPEDTPTREKRGWTADAHIAAEALINNLHMPAFYENFADESVAAQQEDGRVPDIVPTEPHGNWETRSDPAWAASHVLVPAYLHRRYADEQVLVEHYDSLKAYVDYVETTTVDGLLTNPVNTWGNDWLAVETTDSQLFRSGFYYWMLVEVAVAADLAGEPGDAADLRERAKVVAAAVNRAFLDEENATYGPSQFANAFPLTLGIVPADLVDDVVQTLVDDVVTERGNHFTGGLPGIKYIPEALAMHGRSDVVLDVVRNNEHPGWGYMLDNGPGTIWEDWNAASSLNHPMFTSIDNWLYDSVAGITQAPGTVGYRSAVIDPQVTDRVASGRASILTPYGELVSAWRHEGRRLVQDVTVPVNTTAQVHVPAASAGAVLDSGRPAAGRPGVRSLRRVGDHVVVTVGSGRYRFSADPTTGSLLRARTALQAQRARLVRAGVTPAARRALMPWNRQARRHVGAAIKARRDGKGAQVRTRTALALGRVQRLERETAPLRRAGAIRVPARRDVLRLGARARTALSGVAAGHRRLEVTPVAAGSLTVGSRSEIVVRVRNGGGRPVTRARVGLRVPAGWRVAQVKAARQRIPAGKIASARFRVVVPAGQAARDVDLVGVLRGVHGNRKLAVLGGAVVPVEAPLVLASAEAVPRVVEPDVGRTTVRTTVRNRSGQVMPVVVRARQVPEGWTHAPSGTVRIPAGRTATIETQAVRAADDAAPGGRIVVEAVSGATVWGSGSTGAYVRGAGCAADPRGEACLSTDVTLLHSFEDGTDGWVAGEGSASVAAVTSMANGPGGPLLGSRLLEVLPAPGVLGQDWRSVGVDLPVPVRFAPGQDLAVGLNGYGGTQAPYEGRIVVTDSAGLSHEWVQQVVPDSWNRLRMPLTDWAGVDIARIEVSFRGSGGAPWAGRFQVDQVALDATPPPPDQAESLAAGRPVTSDASLNCCGWGTAQVVDGQRVSTPGSRGFTTDPGDPSPDVQRWLRVDLGSSREIGSVWLWPRTATAGEAAGVGGASYPEEFSIQVSDDGTTWQTVSSYTGQRSDGSQGQGYAAAGTGRYVRVLVTRLGRSAPDEVGTRYRVQLAELEVFAP